MEGAETLKHILLIGVTGAIAYHGLTYRDEEGKPDTGHLLFGCIALLFCVRFVFVDVLGVF